MIKLIIAIIIGLVLLQIVSKTLKFIIKLAIFLGIVAVAYYFLNSIPIML